MELKCLVLQSQRRTLYLFESPIEAATPRQVFARPISRFPFTNLPKLFFFFFFVPPTRYDISKDKNPKSSFSLLLRCIIYIYSLVLYTKWIHVHVTFLFVGGKSYQKWWPKRLYRYRGYWPTHFIFDGDFSIRVSNGDGRSPVETPQKLFHVRPEP